MLRMMPLITLQLSEHIISEHLLSSQENIGQRRGVTNGFIIAPHSSAIVTSIHSTLVDRLSISVVPTQSTAVQYLESVQLLQYFDFAGLTESVAEVSSRQFALSNESASQKTILYIEGLDVMIEGTQRRSGLVQANALLSSLLRTLVHLSRTHPCLLVLLDLRLREDSKGDEATLSAFASAIGSDMRLQCGGALGQTLDAGLDVLVLVHDAHGIATTGSAIVEVVKDRVDDALGEWAVWKHG